MLDLSAGSDEFFIDSSLKSLKGQSRSKGRFSVGQQSDEKIGHLGHLLTSKEMVELRLFGEFWGRRGAYNYNLAINTFFGLHSPYIAKRLYKE